MDCDVFVAGALREQVYWQGQRQGTVVAQWPGRARAEVRGDVVLPPERWRAVMGGLYASDLWSVPSSVVWNWDSNVDAFGRHFGHLVRAATLEACEQQASSWFYDPDGLLLYVHPPANAVPPTEGDVYAWIRDGSGMVVSYGERITVDGLRFCLWSDPDPGSGYGLKISEGRESVVSNCVFEDCGYHSAGFVGETCRNNRFVDCIGRGLAGRSNHFVFYASGSDITGCRAERCTALMYSLLDSSGQVLEPRDRCGGFYTHTGGDAVVRDVEFFRCEAVGFAGSLGNAFGTGLPTAAAANPRDTETYPIRFVECVARNCDYANIEGHVAFIRCRLDFRAASESGGNSGACILFNRAGTQVALESCELISRLDGTMARRVIWVKNPNDSLYLFGVTFYDEFADAASRSFVRTDETGYVEAEQCVFASAHSMHLTNGSPVHTAENFAFTNCWYFGIGEGRYSSSNELNERGEWAQLIDQKGWHDINPDFVGAPEDLSPQPEGALWRLRAPLTGVSRHGISGIAYDGRLGAHQYGWPIVNLIASPCPQRGQVKLSWKQAKPNGTLAVLYSRTLGLFRVPPGSPCAGQSIDLGAATITVVGTVRSDLTGSGEVTASLASQACGGFLQMVDLSGCSTTNVIRIE